MVTTVSRFFILGLWLLWFHKQNCYFPSAKVYFPLGAWLLSPSLAHRLLGQLKCYFLRAQSYNWLASTVQTSDSASMASCGLALTTLWSPMGLLESTLLHLLDHRSGHRWGFSYGRNCQSSTHNLSYSLHWSRFDSPPSFDSPTYLCWELVCVISVWIPSLCTWQQSLEWLCSLQGTPAALSVGGGRWGSSTLLEFFKKHCHWSCDHTSTTLWT